VRRTLDSRTPGKCSDLIRFARRFRLVRNIDYAIAALLSAG
jgi:hypothetical protein